VLATVQATVHSPQSDTPEGLKQAIAGRIQALANVHTLFWSRVGGAELRHSSSHRSFAPLFPDARLLPGMKEHARAAMTAPMFCWSERRSG